LEQITNLGTGKFDLEKDEKQESLLSKFKEKDAIDDQLLHRR